MAKVLPLPIAFEVVNPGTCCDKLIISETCLASISEDDKAVIEIGKSWDDSSFAVTVTITSSMTCSCEKTGDAKTPVSKKPNK